MIIMLDKTHSDFPPSSFLFRLANKVASAIPHKGPSANPMAWLSHNPQPFKATPQRSPSDKPMAICCSVSFSFFSDFRVSIPAQMIATANPARIHGNAANTKSFIMFCLRTKSNPVTVKIQKKDINPFLILIVQNETWQI